MILGGDKYRQHRILSIDPGNSMGYAITINGELDECGIWNLAKSNGKCGFVPCDRVLIEQPVIYPHSDVDPNNIAALSRTAGAAAGLLGWSRVEWVKPRTWKGTVPKGVMSERIIKKLTEAERKVYFAAADKIAVSHRHDVIDAIGLGLWALKRL